jgi:inhibitor of KinA
LGDRALTIHVDDDEVAPAGDVVRCLAAQFRDRRPIGVLEVVPALATITLHYDPLATTFAELVAAVAAAEQELVLSPAPARTPIVIPVCYGGEYGPDLDAVANLHGTTPEAIVAQHTAGDYVVAMIGFLPGFPYLTGLTPQLFTPRRSEPRTRVPAGSVGIGGSSTGVYPCESPGGWQLIGRTPRALFNPARGKPALLQPGDHVRFIDVAPAVLRSWIEPA